MEDFKTNIQLNPELVKDYYYSRDFYKEQIKYLDRTKLFLGLGFLLLSLLLGYYKFEKLFYPVLITFCLSFYFLWDHLKYSYLRWRWLKTVNITASNYKNISSADLIINESGIGLRYNDNFDFLYWDVVKQFEIKHNKFLLVFSSEIDYFLIPLKGLSKSIIEQIISILLSKHIYQKPIERTTENNT